MKAIGRPATYLQIFHAKKWSNYGFYCCNFSSVKLWMNKRVTERQAERDRSVSFKDAVCCYDCTSLAIHQCVWSNCGMTLTGEKLKCSGKTLSKCHFVHHKSHMDDWWREVKSERKVVHVQATKAERGLEASLHSFVPSVALLKNTLKKASGKLPQLQLLSLLACA